MFCHDDLLAGVLVELRFLNAIEPDHHDVEVAFQTFVNELLRDYEHGDTSPHALPRCATIIETGLPED